MRFCIEASIDFGSKVEAKWSHKWNQKALKKEQIRDPLPRTRPWMPNGGQGAPKWSHMRVQGPPWGCQLEARGSQNDATTNAKIYDFPNFHEFVFF